MASTTKFTITIVTAEGSEPSSEVIGDIIQNGLEDCLSVTVVED